MQDKLSQIIKYAQNGFAVIPLHNPIGNGCSCDKGDSCGSIGKHPLTSHGLLDATCDPLQIETWLRQYPECNIGMLTGKDSNCVVIDVDNKIERAGDKSLDTLTLYLGELPQTLKQNSGNGYHLMYRYPNEAVIKCTTKLGGLSGLDIRSDGGYIVAEPSVHKNGKQYSFVGGFDVNEIAELPTTWVDFLSASSKDRKAIMTTSTITEGARNDTLFRIATGMRGQGKSDNEIFAEISTINSERVLPPLLSDELRQIVKSASRYPSGSMYNITDDLPPEFKKHLELLPFCSFEKGVLKYSIENKVYPVSNFLPVPVEEIIYDDGRTQERYYSIMAYKVVDGRLKQLETVRVKAANLASMSWMPDCWGFDATVYPPLRSKYDLLYTIINTLGAKCASKRTIYVHTGWREINGKWCFLHNGGAIGDTNVSVDLGSNLKAYDLSTADIPIAEAIDAVRILMTISKPSIIYPLLSIAFLSPLNEFFRHCGFEPAFIVYLVGRTQTKKSTIAALILSFFGRFTASNLPSSFRDTHNALEKKSHMLKDILMVIDDYHPSSNNREKQEMEKLAQYIARGYGDRTGRDRMQVDTMIRQGYAPRGNAIVTGEDIAQIGQSGKARCFFVELNPDDIPGSKELTQSQDAASRGVLAAYMNAYIEWLLPQTKELQQKLKPRFLELRSKAINEHISGMGRSGDITAWLQIGMEYFFDFMAVCCPDLSEEAVIKQKEAAWEVFCGLSSTQTEKAEEDRPTLMFVNAVRELIESGKIHLINLQLNELDSSQRGEMMGYAENDNYYFLPNNIFNAVVSFYRQQNLTFPLTQTRLLRQLACENLIEIEVADTKYYRVQKRFGDTKGRYIKMNKTTFFPQ